MTDQALENAIARREAIKAQVSDIAQQIESLAASIRPVIDEMKAVNDFIRMWYTMAGIEPPPEEVEEEHIATQPLPIPKVERPKNPDRVAVVNKTVEYIREAGRPMMRRELFDRLQADGLIIRGKDPEMVLSTMLWRTKHLIRRLRGGGYWPASDALPADYADDIEDLIG